MAPTRAPFRGYGLRYQEFRRAKRAGRRGSWPAMALIQPARLGVTAQAQRISSRQPLRRAGRVAPQCGTDSSPVRGLRPRYKEFRRARRAGRRRELKGRAAGRVPFLFRPAERPLSSRRPARRREFRPLGQPRHGAGPFWPGRLAHPAPGQPRPQPMAPASPGGRGGWPVRLLANRDLTPRRSPCPGDSARLATLGPRANANLASPVVLLLTSARLRLRPPLSLSAGLATTLAHFLTRRARRRALRPRCSLRMRRGLPTAATELPRLARPTALMGTLRRVVLLKAHRVLLIYVRLRAASSFVVCGTTVRRSATHAAGSAAHPCTARARRPITMG